MALLGVVLVLAQAPVYEVNLADWVAWRVFDLRLSFDAGTKRAMDDRHWFDPGLQLGMGLVLQMMKRP